MASEEQVSPGDSDFNGFVADDDSSEKKFNEEEDPIEEDEVEELGSRDIDLYESREENGSEIDSKWQQSEEEAFEELGSPDLDDSVLDEKRCENGPKINPEQHESDDIEAESDDPLSEEDDPAEQEVSEVKRVYHRVRPSAIRDYPIGLKMPRPEVVSGHVRHSAVRDYPQTLKRHRDIVVSGEAIDEEATLRKRRNVEVEAEIDVSFTYDQDLEEYPVYECYEGQEELDLWLVCPFVEKSLESEEHLLPDSELTFVKQRLNASSVLTDKVIELEDKWCKLHKAQVELNKFTAELIRAEARLILKALD